MVMKWPAESNHSVKGREILVIVGDEEDEEVGCSVTVRLYVGMCFFVEDEISICVSTV